MLKYFKMKVKQPYFYPEDLNIDTYEKTWTKIHC